MRGAFHYLRSHPFAAASAGLFVLVLLTYGRSVGFSFTNWDDSSFILANPHLKQPDMAGLKALLTPGGNPMESLYIPLTYLTYWLECRTFGLNSAVMHGTQVLIHGANVILVCFLLKQLRASLVVTVIAAFLFACHPLQVEAVAWTLGRKDLLATCLGLAALLVWCRLLTRATTSKALATLTVSVVLLGIGAMLAKPSAIILPALLVCVWAYIALSQDRDTSEVRLPAGAAIGLLCLGGMIMYLLNSSQQYIPPYALPTSERLAIWPWVQASWIARLTLISPPLTFYDWPADGIWLKAALGIGLLIVIGVGCVFLARSSKWLALLGISLTAVGFVPTLSISMQYRPFVTADRYGYLPLLGLYLLIGLFGHFLWQKRAKLALVGGLVVAALVLLLQQARLGEWQDSVTLWQAQVEKAGDSPFGYVSLGGALEQAGRDEEAAGAYTQAIKLGTQDEGAYYNLANLMGRYGQHERACQLYTDALRLVPGYVEAMINMGQSLLTLERYQEAILIYQRALGHDSPYRLQVHMNLAITYAELGDVRQALESVSKAQALDPMNPDVEAYRQKFLQRLAESQ